MAIVFSTPHESASGDWSMAVGKSYTCEVWAESDTPVGPDAVLTATGWKIGMTYRWPLTAETPIETHPGLYLQSIRCQPDGEDRDEDQRRQHGLIALGFIHLSACDLPGRLPDSPLYQPLFGR